MNFRIVFIGGRELTCIDMYIYMYNVHFVSCTETMVEVLDPASCAMRPSGPAAGYVHS